AKAIRVRPSAWLSQFRPKSGLMALAMKDLGHSDMRHALFGLVLVPLMMCGSVFAEDAPVAGADPSRSQAVQTGDKQPTTQKTRPPPVQMHHAKSSKPALPLS